MELDGGEGSRNSEGGREEEKEGGRQVEEQEEGEDYFNMARMKEREEVDHVLQALKEEVGRLDHFQVGTTTPPSLAFSGFHSLRALDSEYAQEAVANARLNLNATLRSTVHAFDSLHHQEQDLRLSKKHEKRSTKRNKRKAQLKKTTIMLYVKKTTTYGLSQEPAHQ